MSVCVCQQSVDNSAQNKKGMIVVNSSMSSFLVAFVQNCKRRRPVSLKFSFKGVKIYDEDETVRTLWIAVAML